MKVLLALVALALLACSTSAATTYYTSATGRVFCQINFYRYPIKEVTVKLMDKNTIFDHTIGIARSDKAGNFYVSGSVREYFSSPVPYIKVEYQYRGKYGEMEVNGFLKTIRNDRSPTKSYQNYIYFGDVVFSGENCRAYVNFYNGLADYYNRTMESFPVQPLHIRTDAILNFGEPYARIDTISLPGNYQVTMTTAKMELAHVLRHNLDGNLVHLLSDVARFNYGGPHHCYTSTNKGRAFDEGWAEYWAGGCTSYDYYFRYSSYYQRNYTIIGNVAAGLRSLQRRCTFTYKQMVDVLRRNRGKIHSFKEYEQASYCSPTTMPTTQSPIVYTRPPFGFTRYEGEAQEERKNEEMMSSNEEIIEALMKLLENE